MTTMHNIRTAFPSPQTCKGASAVPDTYCVGGACVRVAWNLLPDEQRFFHHRFPMNNLIAGALMYMNPQLHELLADFYASAIAESNDNEDFDEAWSLVDKALTNRGEIPLDIDADQWFFIENEEE